ncbi:MAG TPA: hypothetical protein VJ875_06825 [Pyrinomonadaceae bacterium]|nr:hypothetical protein [Pyrinomonadaceae bacterium]
MIDLESIDGLLNKAFNLAYFIQRDRNAAVGIVVRSLTKLEVVTAAQRKRLYYRPSGRPWSLRSQSDRLRNKISFNELHLLQRLIYIESEPYEIAQEQGKGPNALGEEDLIIHYIKHLVGKTIKRNAFYVTLGLGRLLHSYTTAETMDIYNAVIQDPERVKDDFYYRSRKGILMQELKERFGDLIRISHGPRGEDRFETDHNQTRFVELVRDCLSFFTPWNTPCLVTPGVDPITEGIPAFSYRGHEEEDKIEVNRIHAVLHPDCFRRLTNDLRVDAPETRLNVPHFFYANNVNSNGSNGERYSATLSEEELKSIKRELDDNAFRRKSAHAGMLRVIVDGNECARFDPRETGSTRFNLNNHADLIEVRSCDDTGEEILLALHPLAYAETDDKVQPADTSIILEGGQKIAIVVSRRSSESGATVDVSYRETSLFRAASLFFYQLARSMSSRSSQVSWNGRRILVPALAVFLITLGLVAIIKYARQGNAPAIEQNQLATNHSLGTANTEGTSPAGTSATDGTKTSNGEKISREQHQVVPSSRTERTARNSAQRRAETRTPEKTATEGDSETRSLNARPAAVPLSAVKKIYVKILGDITSKETMRNAIVEKFGSSGQITVVSNEGDADALLEISVTKSNSAGPGAVDVVVELINARGQAIWPNTKASGKYQGSPIAVSAGIVNDLLHSLQKSP